MTNGILNYGPPPLTEEAADTALDLIDFIRVQVQGVDPIRITPTFRRHWRQHLSNWYQQLPPSTRNWYATAPLLMHTIQTQWPLLDPMQRTAVLQQWAGGLPGMLWMFEPAYAAALSEEAEKAHERMKAIAEKFREQERSG
jgi:hypothetical protein